MVYLLSRFNSEFTKKNAQLKFWLYNIVAPKKNLDFE